MQYSRRNTGISIYVIMKLNISIHLTDMSFFYNLAQQIADVPPEIYSTFVFSLFALDVTSNLRFPRFRFGGADKTLKSQRILSTKGKFPFFFFRMRHWIPYGYISGLYALRWATNMNFRTEFHVLSIVAIDTITAVNTFLMHGGQWTRSLGWDGQLLYVKDSAFLDEYLMRLTEVKFGGAILSLAMLAGHFLWSKHASSIERALDK